MFDDVSTGPVEITSAELSHAGRYSCTAKNAAGSTHRHVQLTVQGKVDQNTLLFGGRTEHNEPKILFQSLLFVDSALCQFIHVKLSI